jgi:hypothetical protein
VYHVSVYHHNLSQFHFTTYDVRRGTDIIYSLVLLIATSPLADNVDATDRSANLHHFLYARALGVYHANVIYTGSGKRDYDNRPLNKTVRSCEPSVFICHVILRLNDPSRGLRRALSPVSIRLRRDETPTACIWSANTVCGGVHWREGVERRVHGALSPRTLSCSVGGYP